MFHLAYRSGQHMNLLTNIDFKRIDNSLAYVEKQCRIPLYLGGFLLGPIYMTTMGKTLLVAGLFFVGINLLLHAVSKNPDPKLLDNARQGAGYIVHGACNFLVGAIATLNLSGNVFLLLGYDYFVGRFHYEYEQPQPGVETLNPYHPSRPEKSFYKKTSGIYE
jgi:hypothetical protein